jgi:hypothetical protein
VHRRLRRKPQRLRQRAGAWRQYSVGTCHVGRVSRV